MKPVRMLILTLAMVLLCGLSMPAQVGGSGTTNYVPLWKNSTTLEDSKIFQTKSNVGVGTTNPQWALDVNGHINSSLGYRIGESPVLTVPGGLNDDNIALGIGALYSDTLGINNTATGYQALYSDNGDNLGLGDGDGNTATGYQALYTNTTGAQNTAEGTAALYSNVTGGFNTANGSGALYTNNLGTQNTAVGSGALYQNTDGCCNTAVGVYALEGNTGGSLLTCIGYECEPSRDGLRNATAIGAHAVVGVSNALVLGGTGQYAVKVGIGTATPSNILTIAEGAGHPVSDGWETFSSRRWKTNIQTLNGSLAKVEQLRGVSYDLTGSGKHEVGVIAEEVGAVVPEVVTYEDNGKDARSVDYTRLTALLIEAVKQQQKEIRNLKSELRATRQTLEKVKAQVDVSQPVFVAAK